VLTCPSGALTSQIAIVDLDAASSHLEAHLRLCHVIGLYSTLVTAPFTARRCCGDQDQKCADDRGELDHGPSRSQDDAIRRDIAAVSFAAITWHMNEHQDKARAEARSDEDEDRGCVQEDPAGGDCSTRQEPSRSGKADCGYSREARPKHDPSETRCVPVAIGAILRNFIYQRGTGNHLREAQKGTSNQQNRYSSHDR